MTKKEEQIQKEFNDLCEKAASITGVDIRRFTGRVRPRSITSVRSAICKAMIDSGYPLMRVSDISNIDRGSVYNYKQQHETYVVYQEGYKELYEELKSSVTPFEVIENPLIKLTAEL